MSSSCSPRGATPARRAPAAGPPGVCAGAPCRLPRPSGSGRGGSRAGVGPPLEPAAPPGPPMPAQAATPPQLPARARFPGAPKPLTRCPGKCPMETAAGPRVRVSEWGGWLLAREPTLVGSAPLAPTHRLPAFLRVGARGARPSLQGMNPGHSMYSSPSASMEPSGLMSRAPIVGVVEHWPPPWSQFRKHLRGSGCEEAAGVGGWSSH